MKTEIELSNYLNELLKEPLNSRQNKVIREWKVTKDYLRCKFFEKFYKVISGKRISENLKEKIKTIEEINSIVWETLNLDFIFRFGNEITTEQLLRITGYTEIQETILLLSNYKILYYLLLYILKNDNNWIISLNRIIDRYDNFYRAFVEFEELIECTSEISNEIIPDEIMEMLATIISEDGNYFNIKNYEDLLNYKKIKNTLCLRILSGDPNVKLNAPIRYYSKEKLYKFALLEYKFGISLDEAVELVEKYGEDAEKLPESILTDYIKLLKEIVENENIIHIVNEAVKNKTLGDPWDGFPTAREAEGKILNFFAELYNKTLYKTTEEDKLENEEIYIDAEGKQYSVKVYKIHKDFNMCVRREGAFALDKKLEVNYKDFYNQPNITYHGNSESFIGNDNIAIAKSNNIIVGYEYIYNNQFAGGSTKVRASSSREGICTIYDGYGFSIYNNKDVRVRIPNEMVNHTRLNGDCGSAIINFNEMFKDRIFLNENNEISRYCPKYVVWVEEDTEQARQKPNWKKVREKDKLWIETKKAAAQLGVPIVIIDREWHAKRETKKTELITKLILGEEIDKNEYEEFLEQYQNLSKPEMIKVLFSKIENNRNRINNK